MIDITGLREDKRPQSSTIVHALLDRLEAAEKAVTEAYQRGYAAGQEEIETERDALRAKIAEMEKQEPVAKVRVHQIGAGGYRDIGTDLTDDALAAIHMLGIIRKYGVNGCLPAQNVPDFADAYQGAMEEVAIWKKRALEAEDLNRKFIAEINGPMLMGEPVAQPAPSISPAGDGRALSDRAKRLVRLIAGTHRGNIETHRELYALIDSMAAAVDLPPSEPAPSVPHGWKLVPIEPTEEMLRAMTDPFIAINGDNRKAFESAYKAMLAAAPEAKP